MTEKGSRLPPDWQPQDTDLLKLGREFPGFDLSAELEQFRDYWISTPGAKALKLNWAATYRNWMRKAAKTPRRRDEPVYRKPQDQPAIVHEVPDHLTFWANRLLLRHIISRNGIGDELPNAMRALKSAVDWFMVPVREGDPIASPREFLRQFGGALDKVSPLAPATREKWREMVRRPEMAKPFDRNMGRELENST